MKSAYSGSYRNRNVQLSLSTPSNDTWLLFFFCLCWLAFRFLANFISENANKWESERFGNKNRTSNQGYFSFLQRSRREFTSHWNADHANGKKICNFQWVFALRLLLPPASNCIFLHSETIFRPALARYWWLTTFYIKIDVSRPSTNLNLCLRSLIVNARTSRAASRFRFSCTSHIIIMACITNFSILSPRSRFIFGACCAFFSLANGSRRIFKLWCWI